MVIKTQQQDSKMTAIQLSAICASIYDVGHINEVTLRLAPLLQERITFRTYRPTVLACNQPFRLTQPIALRGTENKYRTKSSDLQPGR